MCIQCGLGGVKATSRLPGSSCLRHRRRAWPLARMAGQTGEVMRKSEGVGIPLGGCLRGAARGSKSAGMRGFIGKPTHHL